MKIISKYKDYYDYLQGIYGVDEKLILDRTKGTSKLNNIYKGLNILVICGKVIEFVCYEGKFYFDKEISKFNYESELQKKWGSWKGPKPEYILKPDMFYSYRWDHTRVYYTKLSNDIHNLYPKVKELSKECPIFLYNNNQKCIDTIYPSLQELGVNKHIDAKDIWIMLSEWLGNKVTQNEPSIPIGDDKTRILNAGFDLKTSFRH